MPDGEHWGGPAASRARMTENAADGTGDAAAHVGGVANSGVINGPVTVNLWTQSRRSAAVLIAGLLILGLNAAGAVRWPQTSLAWLTIIVGAAAVLLGVPLTWIWSARRGTGWPAEVLFAAAMAMSLLGAAFIGSGGVSVMRDHNLTNGSDSTRPEDAQPGGGVDGSGVPMPTSEPPVEEPPVRRSGTITLRAGYQVDLDSTDPAWGVVKSEYMGDGHVESDLAVALGRIFAIHEAQFSRTTSPSYATCRAATSFEGSIQADEEAAETATACLRTGQHRIAALQVMKVTRSDGFFDEVQLSVTVW